MEKREQVEDCLNTAVMNVWTIAGIEKITLDRNDWLAVIYPIV